MEQLLAHLTGDYLLQNGWIAERKLHNFYVAMLHGLLYTLPFLFITTHHKVLLTIGVSHVLIDYFKLGDRLMWIKEQAAPKSYRCSWSRFQKKFPDEPAYMYFWLRVIIDNTVHIAVNYLAIRYIG